MKKILCMAVLTAMTMSVSAAELRTEDFKYSNVDVVRNGNDLELTMNIDMRDVKLKSNQEIIVTPMLKDASGQMQTFTPVHLVGRNRYYFRKRNSSELPQYTIHNGKNADIDYSSAIPYQDWMKSSKLSFNYSLEGCCNTFSGIAVVDDMALINMEPAVYESELIYIPPVVETVKIRKESGSAFIDFPVGKSVINADYRNNARELAKIAGTIDRIKDDKDMKLTGMSIKGYASPEGPYTVNARLAEARTVALKDYVENLYAFPSKFISTSFDPEDWAGLKKWVEASDLANKTGILEIINSDLEPDAKDQKIKSTYPDDYAFLLKNVYPSLRHSDYVVNFTVRSYTDVAEIIRVMQTSPNKLSLSELYAAAQTMQPGSNEFNETFELAARLFPEDETANLNAANAALSRDDVVSAARYLKKAGNTTEANYARGVLAAKQKDYSTAMGIFKQLNLPQAKKAYSTLEAVTGQPKSKVTLLK